MTLVKFFEDIKRRWATRNQNRAVVARDAGGNWQVERRLITPIGEAETHTLHDAEGEEWQVRVSGTLLYLSGYEGEVQVQFVLDPYWEAWLRRFG